MYALLFVAASFGAVPDDVVEVNIAIELVHDVYSADIKQAKSIPETQALAKRLLSEARKTTEQVGRHALLIVAHDFAIRSGAPETCDGCIEDLAEFGSTLDLRLRSLSILPETCRTESQHTALAKLAQKYAIDGLADDDYRTATTAVEAALEAATNAKNLNLVKSSQALATTIDDYRKQYETLDIKRWPELDVKSAAKLGRFRCLTKGDWGNGIKLMARGDDTYAALAARDITPTEDPVERMLRGNAWVKEAEHAEQQYRYQTRVRAAHWYKLALPDLKDRDAVRIAEAIKQLPSPGEQ